MVPLEIIQTHSGLPRMVSLYTIFKEYQSFFSTSHDIWLKIGSFSVFFFQISAANYRSRIIFAPMADKQVKRRGTASTFTATHKTSCNANVWQSATFLKSVGKSTSEPSVQPLGLIHFDVLEFKPCMKPIDSNTLPLFRTMAMASFGDLTRTVCFRVPLYILLGKIMDF